MNITGSNFREHTIDYRRDNELNWNELKITTTSEASEAVCEMLCTLGAQGVSIEDPQDIIREVRRNDSLDYADESFIENLGEDVILRAYFPETENAAETLNFIQEKLKFISQFLDIGKGIVETCQVNDEDWATSWKKYYKPFLLTERVVIKPTWENYQKEDNEIIVELDPGMAFGTGTHETTKMCSQLLEKYVKSGDNIYDIGTGSGILSIIAAKLGAKKIHSMDIDEVAVRVATENCKINRVDEKIIVSKGIIEDLPDVGVQIIVANIIANVIIDIAKEVNKRLVQQGIFITSGIIRERREEVEEAYRILGFKLVEAVEMGEWVALVMRCPDFS